MAKPKNKITCCGKPLEFKLQKGNSWQVYIPEIAECGTCEAYYEKKPKNKIAYKKTNGGYSCTNCNKEILSKKVSHSFIGGAFGDSGSTDNPEREFVPYCPKCEKEPNGAGKAIPTN